MNLNLISYLSFLIAFQLLFVGIFLLTHKKGNRRNNKLLGTLFVLISWNIGDLTLRMNNVVLQWEFIQVIDDGFFLLYGPIIYLYTKGVIFKDFKLSVRDLLHLIPFFLFTALVLMSGEVRPLTSEEYLGDNLTWHFYLGSGLLYIHFFIYLRLSYRQVKDYRSVIKNKYSQIDQINLDWLTFSLNTFGLLTMVSLIHNFVALAQEPSVFLVTLVLLLFFIFYFVNKVVLKALRQPEIFAGIDQSDVVKYQGSTMSQDQVEDQKEKLLNLIDTEKLYLNPQISLADLSERMSLSSKHLSQVINQSFDKSFFDFINSYRVREVQRILKESNDDKLTVLEAMYEAGFNSKSSFNTAFKKETGQTPTEFRKSL